MKTQPSKVVATTGDNKTKSVELAISAITKQFGTGSIVRLGDNSAIKVEAQPTGSLAIDAALGVGGLPKGRICEIYGPESSGKTTTCLALIAQVQKAGGTAGLVDVEHALDPKWARTCGVNINELLVSQPDSGEDALNIVETLVRSNAIDVVVLDSVAALTTKAELDGAMGDVTMGAQARLMSQAMRRLTAAVSKSKCIVVFTNQIREKIGVMFGNPETTPGGRALKFFASVRMDIRRKDQLKKPDGTVIGNRTKVKIVKNKVSAPFTECEFDILFDEGVSNLGTMLDYGVENKVIEKKGAWYSLEGQLIGQGADAAKQWLREHPEAAGKLEQAIRAKSLKNMTIEESAPAPVTATSVTSDTSESFETAARVDESAA